jgi:hypothetical protein
MFFTDFIALEEDIRFPRGGGVGDVGLPGEASKPLREGAADAFWLVLISSGCIIAAVSGT